MRFPFGTNFARGVLWDNLSIPELRKPLRRTDGAAVMKEIRITPASLLMSVMEVPRHDRP